MKRKISIALIAMMSVVCLAGCGGKNSGDEKPIETPKPSYEEKEVELPEDIKLSNSEEAEGESITATFLNAKGQFVFLSNKTDSSQIENSFSELFIENTLEKSGDWTRKKCKWAEDIDDDLLGSFLCFEVDPELNVMYALSSKYDMESNKTATNLYTIDLLNNTIEKKRMEDFPGEAFERDNIKKASIKVCAGDGTAALYCSGEQGAVSMRLYNIDTGAKINDVPVISESFAMDEYYIYIVQGNDVIKYDKQTMEEQGKINLEKGFTGECKAEVSQDGSIWLMNHNGIYRADADSKKFSLVADSTTLPLLKNTDAYISDFRPMSDDTMYTFFWEKLPVQGESQEQEQKLHLIHYVMK